MALLTGEADTIAKACKISAATPVLGLNTSKTSERV